MAEVGFYHLTRTALLEALPALLGRTLAAGERALVVGRDPASLKELDETLWLSQNPDWLPHGMAGGAHDAWQPILLSQDVAASNEARFLFLIDGAEVPLEGFARVFDLFDGNDEASVAAARARWQRAKGEGHALTYWQQGPKGWVKAAG